MNYRNNITETYLSHVQQYLDEYCDEMNVRRYTVSEQVNKDDFGSQAKKSGSIKCKGKYECKNESCMRRRRGRNRREFRGWTSRFGNFESIFEKDLANSVISLAVFGYN